MFNSGMEFNISLKNTTVVGRLCGSRRTRSIALKDIGLRSAATTQRSVYGSQRVPARGSNRCRPGSQRSTTFRPKQETAPPFRIRARHREFDRGSGKSRSPIGWRSLGRGRRRRPANGLSGRDRPKRTGQRTESGGALEGAWWRQQNRRQDSSLKRRIAPQRTPSR
jgi:hypothetical protein